MRKAETVARKEDAAEEYLGRLRWGDLKYRAREAIHDQRLAEFWVYAELRGKAHSPAAILNELRRMIRDEETPRRMATANSADAFIGHWRRVIESLMSRFEAETGE